MFVAASDVRMPPLASQRFPGVRHSGPRLFGANPESSEVDCYFWIPGFAREGASAPEWRR